MAPNPLPLGCSLNFEEKVTDTGKPGGFSWRERRSRNLPSRLAEELRFYKATQDTTELPNGEWVTTVMFREDSRSNCYELLKSGVFTFENERFVINFIY